MRTLLALVAITLFCGTATAEEAIVFKKGMTINGIDETPKGLVIIPWKVQVPDVALEKIQFTVADDIFQPLDRDVFRRQINYYKVFFPEPVAATTK